MNKFDFADAVQVIMLTYLHGKCTTEEAKKRLIATFNEWLLSEETVRRQYREIEACNWLKKLDSGV